MADSAVQASEFPRPILGERRESYIERVLQYVTRMWEAPFKQHSMEVPPMDTKLETSARRQAEAVFDALQKLREVRRDS